MKVPQSGNAADLQTRSAVRQLQLERGLSPADGLLTPAVLRSLTAPVPSKSRADAFGAPSTPSKPAMSLDGATGHAAPPESVLLKLSDGRSFTVEQALDELRQQNAHAHNGTLGNKLSSFLTGGALGGAFESRDQLVASVERLNQTLTHKGYLTLEERQKLANAVGGALQSIQEVDGIRHDVTGTVTNGVTAGFTVFVAAAAFTLSAPVTVPAALTLAAVGALTRTGLEGALEGKNLTVKKGAEAAVIGAVQGATTLGVGNIAAKVPGVAGAAASEVVAQVAAARVKWGAIKGLISGGVGAGAETAAHAETWKDGPLTGTWRVAKSGALGAAGGAGLGALGGLLGGAFAPKAGQTLAEEAERLGQAKDALVKELTRDFAGKGQGKVSQAAVQEFLDAYSKARALPESGKIPAEVLKPLAEADPKAAGDLFVKAEAYFDVNQQHIQALRRVQAYGGSTRILATFDAKRAPTNVEGFSERFSSGYVEDAYQKAGRPALPTAAARLADREAWYRETYLGKSAQDSVGWQQSKAFVKGTYAEWRATQEHLREHGLHLLKGTFHDGVVFELKPGSQVTFERLGHADDASKDVRSVFLGADQGQGEVEVKNAIDPSFTAGRPYDVQRTYQLTVPKDAHWVFIRGRIEGTEAWRTSATGQVTTDVGRAEQLIIWDVTKGAPVSPADAGVALKLAGEQPIARPR